MSLAIGNQVIDAGLEVLSLQADKVYVCSQQPMTYADASANFALGVKNFGAGNVFGAPANASPNGREVTSTAITDGLVTGNGAVTTWAVVDSANLRLLASGPILLGGLSVLTGQTFQLDSLTITEGTGVIWPAFSTLTGMGGLSASFNVPAKSWHVLKIGSGGLPVGLQVAPDGTAVTRIDISGAYIRLAGTTTWIPVITTGSMPAGDWSVDTANLAGPYEIAIAPSLTTRLYMLHPDGYMYRSDNSGANWSRLTGFTNVPGILTNGLGRSMGRFMAVDPINPNVVYAGTPSSLFVTTDGGTTWNSVPAVGTAIALAPGNTNALDQGGGYIIAFDPSSPQSGSPLRTQGVYVSAYGVGVWHTANAGGLWTELNSAGMPKSHVHSYCDQFGIYWHVDDAGNGGAQSWGHLNKYVIGTSTWSVAIDDTALSPHTVTVDPASNVQATSKVVCMSVVGDMYVSANGGGSFAQLSARSLVATDIPWLATINVFSLCEAAYDQSTGLLVAGAGTGIWTTTPPLSGTVTWTSDSAGIESLTSFGILAPPGGNPVTWSYDIPIFYVSNPDVYPSTRTAANLAGQTIIGGWDADWASSSPGTIVALINGETYPDFIHPVEESGVSFDGGQTWAKFGNSPTEVVASNKVGGNICAASATNFLWAPANGAGNLYYTTDAGGTWNGSVLKKIGGAVTSFVGAFAFYLHRKIIAADRSAVGTFYLYNLGVDAGIYKSTDGGANFNQVYSGNPIGGTGTNDLMLPVPGPGRTGHLFMCCGGPQGGAHPAANALTRSIDGGQSWNAVTGMLEIFAYGFGAPVAPNTYPAILVIGWFNNVFGAWQSINNCVTWTNIGDGFPKGVLSNIRWIDGDKNTQGRWYVSGGTGWFYYG